VVAVLPGWAKSNDILRAPTSSVLLELPGPEAVQGGLWYSTRASTRFGRHYHRELELNVVVTGEAHYWFPHRELRVVAPSALWIPPGVEHELLDTSSDLSMWVHSFRVSAAGVPVGASRATPSRAECFSHAVRELSDGPRVYGIEAEALAQVCARSREGLLRPGVGQLNGIFADILTLAWSGRCPAPARSEPASFHPAAQRAAGLLRDVDCSRSMTALAKTTALSRERLSRLFTQYFGIGLVQYRNHHRVQRFIHDYGQGTGDNMLRVALDVGFGSYAQFHRAFKQVVGCPPAQHLQRVRDGIVDPARTGNLDAALVGSIMARR
jgi:AraC-like DNA-binding protein/quercetin dioxygenase-like cupin family protein